MLLDVMTSCYPSKKNGIIILASHQHFVKKEEKRGSAFSKKRGFLIKKRRKRGIQFSSEEN
jgi:hypothetical protein